MIIQISQRYTYVEYGSYVYYVYLMQNEYVWNIYI